jgi:hypothetical protein
MAATFPPCPKLPMPPRGLRATRRNGEYPRLRISASVSSGRHPYYGVTRELLHSRGDPRHLVIGTMGHALPVEMQ